MLAEHGRKGSAFTFILPEERKYLDAIEKLIGKPIPILDENAGPAAAVASEKPEVKSEDKAAAKAEPKAESKPEAEAVAEPKIASADDKPKRGRGRQERPAKQPAAAKKA